ncbi:MAG: hypothetical protein AB1898_25330 [Acidobacteriota bacterium]
MMPLPLRGVPIGRFLYWAGLACVLVSCASVFAAESDRDSRVKIAWQKERTQGAIEYYRIELDEEGKGRFRYRQREQEPLELDLKLTQATVESLMALFVRADFFNENKEFASSRKVADLGQKTITFDTGLRKRDIVFNYTEDRILQDINNFFENLCLQERALFEMQLALKYDRLGIPKKLDELERSLDAKRIVAPERFAPVLQKIYDDSSLMNLARTEAKKLLARIEKAQVFKN